MPHVSRKRIKKDTAAVLVDQLLAFLSAARSKNEARILAHELLSQTERVMIAKRLAVIVMLVWGYSFLQIERLLGVTPQTVVRIWQSLKNGKYKKIARYALRHTRHFKTEGLLDSFEKLLLMGMPPRSGRARFKQFNKSLGH